MKLTDIIVQEEAPAGPIELSDLTKYFPNTYRKAIQTLIKSDRLVFNGEKLFKKDGDYGPALDQASANAEALLKDEDNTIDFRVEMDGSVADIDDGGEFSADYPIDDAEEVYIGYDPRRKKLIVGFDAWLDEDIFNQDWDEQFERIFGEEFDYDNPKHEAIFDDAWEKFKKGAFMGLVVEVDEDGNATFEDMPYEGGFYKGAYPSLKSRLVDLRLD